MDEKRREPRIKVNWPIEIFLGDRTIEGIAKNITLKGLFVCCEEPLSLKKDFRLLIFTPNKKAIDVIGKVVWSDAYAVDIDNNNAPVCVGLSFVEISTSSLNSLKEIVQNYRGLD